MRVDVVVFGGGVAGLWFLDAAVRRGYSAVLLEAHALGFGQTIGAQGIVHGGLKYTLDGLLNRSAAALKDVPAYWRACLAGTGEADLRDTEIRAEFCHLWRTTDLMSRLGMIGAKVGLSVKPVSLPRDEWPSVLSKVSGQVLSLNEPVIDPGSMLANLASRHQARLFKYDKKTLELGLAGGRVSSVHVGDGQGRTLAIEPSAVVLTAGAGNGELRERAGLPNGMQRRPLHMVMVRGALPALNGHCTDGAQTRMTITTSHDADGRTVWQLGGQISELGVKLGAEELVALAQRELREVVPGVDLAGAELSTYAVDRAEPATDGGKRPAEAFVERNDNIVTAWPVKMAHAPHMADRVLAVLDAPSVVAAEFPEWTRPVCAKPAWIEEAVWIPAS